MKLQRVVVALDLSPASRAALVRARDIAGAGARLHLVHVVDSVIETSAPRHATPPEMDAYRKKRTREASLALEEIAHAVRREDPRRAVETEIRFGRPADELLAAGAHGRNVLDRLFLGSVAEEVARRSPVPTLVVGALAGPSASVERVL